MNRDFGKAGDRLAPEEAAEKAGFHCCGRAARLYSMGRRGFRLRAQRLTIKSCSGVGDAEPLGGCQIVLLGDPIEGRPQPRWAGLDIMCVGREEVDPSVVQQPMGGALRLWAKAASKGAGRDLD